MGSLYVTSNVLSVLHSLVGWLRVRISLLILMFVGGPRFAVLYLMFHGPLRVRGSIINKSINKSNRRIKVRGENMLDL